MLSTTLMCMFHLCRLILSSSHLLLCLIEDNPYLVDMCLVGGLIMMLILMHLRGLNIQELLVYLYRELHCIEYYTVILIILWSILCMCLSSLVLGELCPKADSYI